ncbi:MAG: protein kinase [Spirosomataceae bacterium]
MTYDDFKKRYRYDPANDILGEGAFGKVFRATDTESGSTVAIKVAPVNLSNESHSLKHEFETVGKVDPHLHIALYDECYRFSVEWAGLHDFAVLEYYPLGSLDKIIRNQKLTDTEKHDLAVGILEGLRHLHNTGSQGVVHRDLKPRNVLIQKWRGKFVPKITDFGLSKFSDSVSNSVISQSFKGGTLNYASPEQIKGEQIRRNTDLWSFGVILHEIMTGEVPYKIDNSSESTLRQVYERMNRQSLPESFNQVKEPYASVIKKCLMVNPNLRYRSAEEVLQDIRKVPEVTPPVPVVSEPKKIIKDQTEIFEDNLFGSFGNVMQDSTPFSPPQPPSEKETSEPIEQSEPKEKSTLKPDLEGSGYVKSDPKPKDTNKAKPKKDLTTFIVAAVVVLGIITFAVIYWGGGSKKEEIASADTSLTKTESKIMAAIDTAALGRRADSLFSLPNYPEYARIILTINETYPNTAGVYSKQTALQKLKKSAAGWESSSLTDPDTRSFLEAFSQAMLILDPYDSKGLELQQKIK